MCKNIILSFVSFTHTWCLPCDAFVWSKNALNDLSRATYKTTNNNNNKMSNTRIKGHKKKHIKQIKIEQTIYTKEKLKYTSNIRDSIEILLNQFFHCRINIKYSNWWIEMCEWNSLESRFFCSFIRLSQTLMWSSSSM